MESPQVLSPPQQSPFSRSRSNTKIADDVTSLTSFNPFSEEDENDQSSYALVTSLFSRVRNSIAAPLSSAVAAASGATTSNATAPSSTAGNEQKKTPGPLLQSSQPNLTSRNLSERPMTLALKSPKPAQPFVSLFPVVSEAPSLGTEYERSPSRSGNFYEEGGLFGGTAIPGFPIQDDARSIRTSASTTIKRSDSVSKIIRRIRGEGLSRDYWMDDENCKECSDCQSVFTTWRRKHHCRICGLIFCSRCASNIINGARFGHDGTIRVCNICLEKLAKVDSDEEDDRRSIVSSMTSPFPAHQLGLDSLPNIGRHPQSPFAAAQLFGRTDEPFNLYSIAETKRPITNMDEKNSTPLANAPEDTPNDSWQIARDTPAPFRRGVSEEEKEVLNLPNSFAGDDSPTVIGTKTPVDFPIAVPAPVENTGTSSIQFPLISPEHAQGLDSPRPGSRYRSRFNSYGDFDCATPFIRSRAQSRLDMVGAGDPGWRTRRESTAYAQELNNISMRHLKVMLRQMLTTEQVPNIKEWEETLLKLALRIARELTFTSLPQRQGQDMDIRRYVKIKKIPGGVPSDSEYVDGAVITKNIAHKQMSKSQRNPRVMLVTFPLEYGRGKGQYLHITQLVAQEREFLVNLASRIAALRPHVVLVEKSVSRLALDALVEQHIVVARTVKPSAIQFVARMTQGDVLSSIDKLALEPRLGHCARYRIQTFDHHLIPGQRKTYMRFEGCGRDMGCTILLRGGDINTLRHIKKVTRFLTFVVRNLKLETHLWKDSVITLPSFNVLAMPVSDSSSISFLPASYLYTLPALLSMSASTSRVATPLGLSRNVSTMTDDTDIPENLSDEEALQLQLSKQIQSSLEPYKKTFVSVSATLRFSPPQAIWRMEELDNELAQIRKASKEEQENKNAIHNQEPTVTAPTSNAHLHSSTPKGAPVPVSDPQNQADISALIEALPIANIPRTPTLQDGASPLPTNFNETSDYFGDASSSSTSTSGSLLLGSPDLSLLPEDPTSIMKTDDSIALESQLSLLNCRHEEYQRIWEWYLRKNKDDFVLEKYQCIYIWQYTLPTVDFGLHHACFVPQLYFITFYGENDCTLGQFIEKSVSETLISLLDPKAICNGKGCNQSLARHGHVYVHNETRLFVAVEQWDGQIIGPSIHSPLPDLITTWSVCRKCGSATPFIPVSEEMQRYSFAKFLELHFYPADVKIVQGAGCEHNIYQHHVRYFACKGMTVRFQADPITLHEVVYPPMRIRVRPETQLQIKNTDFQRLHRQNIDWYSALISDLKLINIDAATGDEESDARLTTEINVLISRAEAEREEVARIINAVYKDSAANDTLALNKVRAFRQDRIVAWQQDFDRLPKPRGPPVALEKNSRKVSSFTSVRIFPKRNDITGAFEPPLVGPTGALETEESPSRLKRKVTVDPFTSSASEASESEITAESLQAGDTQVETSVSGFSSLTGEPSSVSADNGTKTDAESDSTVGAAKDGSLSSSLTPASPTSDRRFDSKASLSLSRLPRRSVNQPSVAELVRKYSDYLPPQGVRDLAKTAFAPPLPISESDQDSAAPAPDRPTTRSKTRHHSLGKKASYSDFEQGYAANIAPRYLTHYRRPQGRAHQGTRIPGPVFSPTESVGSSRRQSPDKRIISGPAHMEPGPGKGLVSPVKPAGVPGTKNPRVKTPLRHPRDRSTPRPPPGTTRTHRRQPGPGTKVSNIAKHFERINRENERANRRYTVIRGKRARPVASARAKVEVLESVKDAIKYDESESSDASSQADDEGDGFDERPQPDHKLSVTPPPEPPVIPKVVLDSTVDVPETASSQAPVEIQVDAKASNAALTSPYDVNHETQTQPPSPFLHPAPPSFTPPVPEEDTGSPVPVGTPSLFQALGYWLQQNHTDIDDSLVHIFRDSSMVVRTDEPTSIIALALSSPQYREMLASSRADKCAGREPKITEKSEDFMPDEGSFTEPFSSWGVVNIESTDPADPIEDLKTPPSRSPWAISFESAGWTISCTVLYPEHFDTLRRAYDCDRSMIESLARCVKWDASGGKSGSAFLKTRDDRFIAKEISRTEMQTMEMFAPAYFDYMSSAITAKRPTLLAKVFGCYKLTFKRANRDKNPGRSKSTQMNLLVMENLFYDRSFSKIYDLKGSTRGRHVQSTGRENEVLLDENLIQTAQISPFYLREHSKRILRCALSNDSKFLSDINVMDYSLVVGVDSLKNELVVGIVDYIRTYTWDKRLETWVKESAFMGGAGKGEPTIVTPKQYRQRFISAMETYFPLVPDRWMKRKDVPLEDSINDW